jgi:hypothetical protein
VEFQLFELLDFVFGGEVGEQGDGFLLLLGFLGFSGWLGVAGGVRVCSAWARE